ncbi:hypothetical protein [uncultured Sulfuricurvum sp.]|uniref:hypothetical protein n=1 Tax=uncultured Sulfuricurvum sp. TaxID=430693 RepID=UPI0026176520|nr:hypothetical protein [uncultured Sulfuricurvum sp.]
MKKYLTAMSVTLFMTILSNAMAPSIAVAGSITDCEPEPLYALYTLKSGEVSTGWWRIKRGSFCELRQGSVGYPYKPIEVISAPKECKVITNKSAVAITCNRTGNFLLQYRLHGTSKDGMQKTYIDIRREIIVFE